MGIKACYISGEQDNDYVKESVLKGDYQVVYFTPEMILGSKRWREMLVGEVYSKHLRTFVVDEAHTVKKWYDIILCFTLSLSYFIGERLSENYF